MSATWIRSWTMTSNSLGPRLHSNCSLNRTFTSTCFNTQKPPLLRSLSLSRTSTTRRHLAYRIMPSNQKPSVKMIILEVDEAHPDDVAEKGNYGEILHRHFVKAGNNHDPPLGIQTDTRFVVPEKGGKIPRIEDFEGVTGVLITGSTFDAHGDDEWITDLIALLKEVWTKRPEVHFSGVCFGHQLLCRMLGANVRPEPSSEWEIGHSQINLHDIGKTLFRTTDDEIFLNQMHQDQVESPPTYDTAGGLLSKDQKIEVWGHSPHTKVQGVYLMNRLFTSQAHMAFDPQMVRREIQMRIDSGALQDMALAEEAKGNSHLEHDGEVLAAAILRFFHYEDDGLE